LQHALTIVGAADYPRQFVVEEDGSNIVQVAVEGEQTAPGLIGPDLDLVVITTGDKPVSVSVYSCS